MTDRIPVSKFLILLWRLHALSEKAKANFSSWFLIYSQGEKLLLDNLVCDSFMI